MNTASSIRYTVCSDTSPEAELNALAAVYKFVIASRKGTTRPGGPNNGTKSKEDSANDILPHQP